MGSEVRAPTDLDQCPAHPHVWVGGQKHACPEILSTDHGEEGAGPRSACEGVAPGEGLEDALRLFRPRFLGRGGQRPGDGEEKAD